MLQPSGNMASTGIIMSPVDDAPFVVPLILTVESHRISCLQRGDFWSKVDVVCDQQVLSGLQFENEPLMPAPIVIIRQHLDHLALTLELNPAGPAFLCSSQRGIVRRFHTGRVASNRRKLAILRQPGIAGHNQDDEEKELSHVTHPEKQFGLRHSRSKPLFFKDTGRGMRRIALRATQCGPQSRTPYEIAAA